MEILELRTRKKNLIEPKNDSKIILLVISRDRRINDNWSLIYAQKVAKEKKLKFVVALFEKFKINSQNIRQQNLISEGIKNFSDNAKKIGIEYTIFKNEFSAAAINEFCKKNSVHSVVVDFNPLKEIQNELPKIKFSLIEVDSHNIVPCWIASNKQEFGAYTIRKKINRQLSVYLNNFDNSKKSLSKAANLNNYIGVEKRALEKLKNFIENKIENYKTQKNDPNEKALSELSAFINLGFISSQRIAIEIIKNKKVSKQNAECFLEELIIRRELSDNFCLNNKNYDSLNSAPRWALETLKIHSKDKREYNYSLKQFENSQTHDELWNAAQREMLNTGKMHGYMRMYWAKKILEWTKSPSIAIKIAICLNDKYSLDGNDPNGYVGVLWSIAGLHDRAWGEREVFGKVRYMSFNGCKSKFDVKNYIETNSLSNISKKQKIK